MSILLLFIVTLLSQTSFCPKHSLVFAAQMLVYVVATIVALPPAASNILLEFVVFQYFVGFAGAALFFFFALNRFASQVILLVSAAAFASTAGFDLLCRLLCRHYLRFQLRYGRTYFAFVAAVPTVIMPAHMRFARTCQ